MSQRVWEEISYNRLEHNLDLIKKLSNSKKIICMVKDDAYGIGSVNISKYLEQDENITAFAVASIKEANELRQSGIKKNIIIISHIFDDEYASAIINDYIITISTYEQASIISETARQLNKTAWLEIALDTGMGRIGFVLGKDKDSIDSNVDIIEKISKLSNIHIYGFYSHFSVADCDESDKENSQYTDEQLKKFNLFIEEVNKRNILYDETSISNSAAIITNKGLNCSSIRPGIILYGIAPNKQFVDAGFLPIMSLKSRIVHIKEVDKDYSISYGRTYKTNTKTKIATVSCGYGDGYPRTASNTTSVIINDKKCKVLGRITMDAFMVDVTKVDCKVNDEVILIGESQNEKVSLQEICDLTKEFTYELLVRINKRVERVFV